MTGLGGRNNPSQNPLNQLTNPADLDFVHSPAGFCGYTVGLTNSTSLVSPTTAFTLVPCLPAPVPALTLGSAPSDYALSLSCTVAGQKITNLIAEQTNVATAAGGTT